MTPIFKPIETFFTEPHKANLEDTAKIKASQKTRRAKRDALTALIDKGETVAAPDLKTRVENLMSGTKTPVASLEDQRREILYAIDDGEKLLDELAVKEKAYRDEAGAKMVLDQKTQIVASEKEMYDAVQTLFNKFVPYFNAKRSLLNNSVTTLGLFGSPIDDILGIPVGVNSAWADIFRHGVERGHVKMPAALRPKS